jgi:hypothetical protein
VVTLLERELLGEQAPRVKSVPPYVASKGLEAIEVAEAFGIELDPWQKSTLIDACGVREDGKWAAFEVGLDVPRQNGKGGVIEPRELAGIFAWGERLVLHSAHEFPTATEAMLRMEDILAGTPEYAAQVKSVSRSHGSEGFIFKSGQRLRYRTRTKGGGRGWSAETLIFDEAMILIAAFIGALLPTLSAKSMTGNPQVWYAGSAVDQLLNEYGIVFARLRARGHRGGDPSLAWFEWAATDAVDEKGEPITPDHPIVALLLEDVRAWAAANPALGIRISAEHIEKELLSMGAREFAVERLGIGDYPDLSENANMPIDLDAWDALVDERSELLDPVALAFDVSPDRGSVSISAAGRRRDGLWHVEVIEQHRGTGALVDRMVALDGEHEPIGILFDTSSPAASLVPDLEKAGVTVTPVTTVEHAQACGLLYDNVDQETVRHLGDADLRAALKGAKKRPVGDAWAWSRKNSGINITPLVSATLALWGARTIEAPSSGEPMWAFA